MKMLYYDRMTQTIGYQMTDKDIESAMLYLKTQGEPCSREDAINHLEEKAALAHMAAEKIVADEQSGKIDPVKLKKD